MGMDNIVVIVGRGGRRWYGVINGDENKIKNKSL